MLKKNNLEKIFSVITLSIKLFFADGCMYRAGALAYTSLLSLVPLLTVCFAVISAFPIFKDLTAQIQNFIFSHFVATSGEVIEHYVLYFINQTKNLSAVGFLSLVIVAILMMFNLEESFNAIWHVPSRKKDLQAFLLYWAILTLAPILVSFSILTSHYVSSLSWVNIILSFFNGQHTFHNLLPFFMSWLFFLLLYRGMPNIHVLFSHALFGSMVTAILFEFAKRFFSFYVAFFPSYVLLYGALATIPIFLIWLYTVWFIILYGAVLTRVLSLNQKKNSKKLSGFRHAYRWFFYFYQAFLNGGSLSLAMLIAADECDYEIAPEAMIEFFINKGWIHETCKHYYILAKDPGALSLNDFNHQLPWHFDPFDSLEESRHPAEIALWQKFKELSHYQSQLMNDKLLNVFANIIHR